MEIHRVVEIVSTTLHFLREIGFRVCFTVRGVTRLGSHDYNIRFGEKNGIE